LCAGDPESELGGSRKLTPNERRILARLIDGKRTPAIAAELGVSVHTVRTVCKSIREKFGMRHMRDIVAECRSQEASGEA
jgi:DNA-binding CsgD family transcriptional regulator